MCEAQGFFGLCVGGQCGLFVLFQAFQVNSWPEAQVFGCVGEHKADQPDSPFFFSRPTPGNF